MKVEFRELPKKLTKFERFTLKKALKQNQSNLRKLHRVTPERAIKRVRKSIQGNLFSYIVYDNKNKLVTKERLSYYTLNELEEMYKAILTKAEELYAIQ